VPLVTVPLVNVAPATPRSQLVTVDVLGLAFDFTPGQAVLIGAHGQPDRRPYSIASSPERVSETHQLELLIALDDGGAIGPHLPAARPGMLVDMDGPLGTFMFPEAPAQPRLLFVAGGTGIAPLRAMIDHVLRRDLSLELSLLYSARRADEFAFLDELVRHADAARLELHLTVTRDESTTWAGRRGRIGRSHFESVLHDASATLCFVCGPRAMVTDATLTLQELGVPESAIRTEAWATLKE
jgi:glycine betaine catabolism B